MPIVSREVMAEFAHSRRARAEDMGQQPGAEFDMFMAERRNRDGHAGDVSQPQG